MISRRDLIERLNLRDMAEEAGARFVHLGRGSSSHCPLHHGDNPSAFHLYKRKGGEWRYHCFTRCPKRRNDGDAVSFYMSWKHVGYETALAERRV